MPKCSVVSDTERTRSYLENNLDLLMGLMNDLMSRRQIIVSYMILQKELGAGDIQSPQLNCAVSVLGNARLFVTQIFVTILRTSTLQ